MRSDVHPMQFWKRERFRDREKYRKQFWGSGGLSKQNRGEGPSGCESRIGVRRVKEARRPKGSGRIKRTESSVFYFIRSLILHEHISHPYDAGITN